MNGKAIIPIAIVLLGIFIFNQVTFTVDETKQVIVTQFGKPVGEPITEPGIYFKIPFTQTANFFEKRYMEWDGDPNQMPTKDKKFIYVDTYARWQITDPLKFFKRLTNERGAHSRLDDILDGETRNFIAKNNLEEAVRTSNRQPALDTTIGVTSDSLSHIYIGREKIQEQILKASNKQTSDLGIEILDFRFKRINYAKEVRERVYERMKSERFRIAEKFRSEGMGEASRINGEKERDLKKIQSEAYRTSEEIMGKADAEATKIYAEAYNKTGQAKELYTFLKSLETLKNTMDDETSVIMSTDSDLYKYLKNVK